jgi:hypothetical protein
MGNLKQIGKTGVMLNKDLKDVKDPALKEALKIILKRPKKKKEEKNGKKMTIG